MTDGCPSFRDNALLSSNCKALNIRGMLVSSLCCCDPSGNIYCPKLESDCREAWGDLFNKVLLLLFPFLLIWREKLQRCGASLKMCVCELLKNQSQPLTNEQWQRKLCDLLYTCFLTSLLFFVCQLIFYKTCTPCVWQNLPSLIQMETRKTKSQQEFVA